MTIVNLLILILNSVIEWWTNLLILDIELIDLQLFLTVHQYIIIEVILIYVLAISIDLITVLILIN